MEFGRYEVTHRTVEDPILSHVCHSHQCPVYSFDHVAINDKVTACDMKKVPLADEALDVAVFSLSLMGKNWYDYIKEAKRCLVTNGILIIAETTKSMKGRLSKLRDIIKDEGFETYIDEERGDFTFIEAREL